MQRLIVLLLLLNLGVPLSLHAQSVSYTHFTVKEGLASNTIYYILEDRNHFIWIATDRGVSRYDGVKFSNFTADDGLPDNDVINIIEDSVGRIWFMCFSVQPCYYYGGKIYNAENDVFLKNLSQFHAESLYNYAKDLKKGILYFLIEQHGKNYYVSKDRIDSIPAGEFIGNGGVSTQFLVEHAGKKLVLHSKGGVLLPHNQTLSLLDSLKSISGSDMRGKYFIFYGFQQRKLYAYDTEAGIISAISSGPEPDAVFSQNNKLFLLKNKTIEEWELGSIQLKKKIHIDFQARNICADLAGNIWLGSADEGLFLIRKNASQRLDKTPFPTPGVLCLQYYQQQLFLGTSSKGVYTITGKTFAMTPVNDLKITGMEVLDNKLYIGANSGLWVWDGKLIQQLGKASVKDLAIYLDGRLIVGNAAGIHLLNPKHPAQQERIFKQRTTAVCCNKKGDILIGTLRGLWICKQTPSGWSSQKVKTHSALDESHISDIQVDFNDNLWISTSQFGVFHYKNDGSTISFADNSPFHITSNDCKSISIDSNGTIYICHQRGLSTIRPMESKNFSIQNFSHADGLPDGAINDILIENGYLLVAGNSGCFRYLPQKQHFQPATVEITKIYANNQIVTGNIGSFAPNQNNLILHYTSSFINTSPGKYQFQYRVIGLNDKWINTNSTQLTLLGLSSGEYEFQIRALDDSGNTGPLNSFTFIILTPWYRQPLFIVTGILSAILIILYLLKREKKRIDLSKDLAQLELKVLRSQMNPHFIYNSLNAIQRFAFRQNFEVVNNYIHNFAQLMRSSLHFSRTETITLEEELNFLQRYLDLEKMRFEHLFEYQVELQLEADDEPTDFSIPAFMIQPLLENSIKHGFKSIKSGGLIHIRMELQADKRVIRILVTDNGKGLHLEPNIGQEHPSLGLSIITQRISLLKGRFRKLPISFRINNRTDGDGTIAELYLPVSQP